MNEDNKLPDVEFDNKVYDALTKKLLPDIQFDEPKDISSLVGFTVLLYLAFLAVVVVVDAYTQKHYNKTLIEFRQ